MTPVDLVKLTALMDITSGKPEITVGLIDGPILLNHPALAHKNIREVPAKLAGTCVNANSTACMHGTMVAGMLFAKRGSAAPSICPACTLLVRPIFAESASGLRRNGGDAESLPGATPDELAQAITDCIDAGARVINLSAALAHPASKRERELEESLDYAVHRGVVVVAAAGNQGTLGSSAITRHPWVLPVVACDLGGRPISYSNLAHSTGMRGLCAPGHNISTVGTAGGATVFSGTSAAAPFVTGAIALLWSEFPSASAADVRLSVLQAAGARRRTIVPPLLDAWAAYQAVKAHV